MLDSNSDRFISSFLEIIPPQLSSDYAYYNVIKEHYPRIREVLLRLKEKEKWETLIALRSRLRRFFELSGQYSEGLTAAEAYLLAARGLSMHEEEAWIETKDISWLYILSHEYQKAVTHLHRGLEIFNSLGRSETKGATIGRFYALRYLGVAHELLASPSLRDFSRAEEYFDKAMSIVTTLGKNKHPELWARINQNYGNLHLDKGLFREAEKHYRESLNVFAGLDDKEHIAGAVIKVGKACLFQAVRYADRHVSYSTRMEVNRLINEAEKHLTHGWEQSMELGWVEGQARCKEHLAKVFELQNQLSLALKTAKEALTTYRSIQSLKNISAMEERVNDLLARANGEAEIDAFIVMPMDNADAMLPDYYHAVVEAFDKCGLRATRTDDITSTSKISDRIVSLIESADFVVSDLTHERPNVYYETGLAHSLKKKVILTARKGTNIHFDVQDYEVVFYDNVTSLKKRLLVIIEKLKQGGPS